MAISNSQRCARAALRVETAATRVFNEAELSAVTGRSIFDVMLRRRALLAAAREYGFAIRALARLRV